MTSARIVCEGRTEVEFVRQVLAPRMPAIAFHPILIGTRRGQPGGNVSKERLVGAMAALCRIHRDALVSCIVDYYGIGPSIMAEAFGAGHAPGDPLQIARGLDTWLRKALAHELGDNYQDRRILPCFSVHEWEALLFSDTAVLSTVLLDGAAREKLDAIVAGFPTPEHINNDRRTAPSKRLRAIDRTYNKVTDGMIAAKRIGIDRMARECRVFREWVERMDGVEGGRVE